MQSSSCKRMSVPEMLASAARHQDLSILFCGSPRRASKNSRRRAWHAGWLSPEPHKPFSGGEHWAVTYRKLAPSRGGRTLKELELARSRERLDTISDLNLAENLIHAPFRRADRHREPGGNFLIGEATIEEA